MRARTESTLPVLVLALVALAPAAARAQVPASDLPLSLAVHPAYHVSVGFAHASWSGVPLSGANGLSVSASRHMSGPLQVTFDFATLSGNTVSGAGVEAARHYLVNAALAVAPELLADGHVVQPRVGVGIGTLVSAPAADSSSTRSQNAWEMIAGVDVGVAGPFTVGVRYQRVAVKLQDVAAQGPTVAGTPAKANVISLRVGVRF